MNKGILFTELIIYLAAMLWIGLHFARKGLSESEYILGGKKLPGWALAFSERATAESAWLMLGATGFCFAHGLSSIWMLMGSVAGIIVSWYWLARKFREEADKYNALTLPDYLASKYGHFANIIRWFGGIIIIFFFTLYVAAQFSGAGKTLNVTFGMSPQLAIVLTAIIVITYACAGGFMSVVWTDVVQSILMIVTLVVLPIIALIKIGTSDLSMGAALTNLGGGMDSWTGTATGFGIGIMIFVNFSWFFGWLGGQPHLSARFMALKDDKDAKTATRVAMIWMVLCYVGVFMIGLTAATLYGGKNVVSSPEMILPFMLLDLMPTWIAGILLAGAIAAMMSTADSQLLVSGSSLSEDIIHKAMGKKLDEKKMVLASRICVLVVGIVALIFAFTSKSLIYTIVSWAWSGIGCTFSAAIIMAFFWKKTSGAGVVAGLVGGFLTTVVWMNTPLDKIFTTRAMTFIVALAAVIVFSLIFPKKEEAK